MPTPIRGGTRRRATPRGDGRAAAGDVARRRRPVTSAAAELEYTARACAPDVLAALVRRYGDFDAAEDAVQEALVAAARQWPVDGLPDNPRGWLIRVASRRWTSGGPSRPAPTGSCSWPCTPHQMRPCSPRPPTPPTAPRVTTPWRCCCCAAIRR